MSDINDELRGAAEDARRDVMNAVEKTFGETLTEAIEQANHALGYCDGGFEDAWAAFASRLRRAGLEALPLSLLDEAIQHLPPRMI